MAKTSVSERQKRRVQLCEKYREKRAKLKEIILAPLSSDAANDAASPSENNEAKKWEAMLALQKLPRNSSRTRLRNRCSLCGRPRAYNRRTGLCRIHHRDISLKGFIPGERKASW